MSTSEPHRQSDGPAHFLALDSLRGIAALTVAFGHVCWMNPTLTWNFVRNSYLMVDVFFVLSGFVIFYAYGRRLNGRSDVVRFMWLRFWRLYPLHFTMLLLFLLFEFSRALAGAHGGAHQAVFVENNLFSFVTNALLIHSLHVHSTLTYNHPSWSISVEFYTYFVFAAVVLLARAKWRICAVAAAIMSLGVVGLWFVGMQDLDLTYDFGILRCFTGFFLGVLLYATYEWCRDRAGASFPAWSRIFGRCAVAGMVVFAAVLVFKPPHSSDVVIYPISALVIICVALSGTSASTAFLRAKPFLWLGEVSYSIYMVHWLVVILTSIVLKRVLHAPEIVYLGGPVVSVPLLVGLAVMILCIGVVLLLSHLSYTRLERPLRDWSRTKLRAKPPAGASAQPAAGS